MELVRQASGAAAATLDQVLGLDTDDAATVIQSIFREALRRSEESSGSNWHGESPTRRAGSSRLGMQRAGSRG